MTYSRKYMEGCRGITRRGTVDGAFWRLQDKRKPKIEERERLAPRSKVNREKHLRGIWGVEERYESFYDSLPNFAGLFGGAIAESIILELKRTRYLHGPMDYAKKTKLRFRAGDLDLLLERRNRFSSSRTRTYKKEEIYLGVVGRRRAWLHICARLAQQQRVGPTKWENESFYGRPPDFSSTTSSVSKAAHGRIS